VAGRKNGDSTGKDGRFQPGNPGRPHGSTNKTTLAVETLLQGQAEALTLACIERALQGDGIAMKLALERICPVRRGRPVLFDLPEISSAADLSKSLGAVLKATASGSLTPDEASAIAQIIDARRRAIETAELEARVEILEKITR
jgi:hypothetical protein